MGTHVLESIFSGITVLDITKVLSGPLATRYLADYGATVIKVENPNSPDDTRQFPPLKNNWSGYFEMLNRNKKSVSIDLTSDTGKAAFYKLASQADVIVENLSPKSKYKLGIDYESVLPYNNKIVYASLAGLDQTSDRKYYDVIAQAESGLMSLTGTPDSPTKIGPAVVDAFSGVNLAFAIASALFYREKTGKGQSIEVSMLGSAMNLLEQNITEYSITKTNPVRVGNQDNAIAPFGVFKTKDSFIVLAAGSDTLWQKFQLFLQSIEPFDSKEFSTNSERLEHINSLQTTVETRFANQTTAQLIEALNAIGIPCSKLREMSDIYTDEWFYASGSLIKAVHSTLGECVTPGKAIIFSRDEKKSQSEAPHVGQHNSDYGI